MERFDIQLSRVERNVRRILHRLHRQEGILRAMTTADINLTQAIQDVTAAYSATIAAMQTELSTLRAQQTVTDDPVVLASINSLEKLAQDMRTNTAAMQAAVAPTSPTTTETPTDSTYTQPVSTTAAPTASDPTTTHGAVPTAVSPTPVTTGTLADPNASSPTTSTTDVMPTQAPTTGLPVAAPTDLDTTQPVTTGSKSVDEVVAPTGVATNTTTTN